MQTTSVWAEELLPDWYWSKWHGYMSKINLLRLPFQNEEERNSQENLLLNTASFPLLVVCLMRIELTLISINFRNVRLAPKADTRLWRAFVKGGLFGWIPQRGSIVL